jgi:ABC-type polysaccharide/polyol phosphate transport system ATPase subunit
MIQVNNASVVFQRKTKGRVSLKASLLSKIEQRLLKKNSITEPFYALKDISFEVEKGEVLGVIGNNGAGKSTLLRLVAGIYQPDSGSVKVNGTISALLSLGAGFEDELTGIDNIYLNSLYMGLTEKKVDRLVDNIVTFSGLSDFIYQPVKTYSSGMRARLGFSISYFVRCEIMLIDEVLGVGDKEFKAKSNQAITDLIKSDVTVLLVSHNMNTIQELCGRTIWLEKGRFNAIGRSNEIINIYK